MNDAVLNVTQARRRIHERHVCVTEEQKVGVLLQRAILRAQQPRLHPQRVPVRDEHAVIVYDQHTLERFKTPEVRARCARLTWS